MTACDAFGHAHGDFIKFIFYQSLGHFALRLEFLAISPPLARIRQEPSISAHANLKKIGVGETIARCIVMRLELWWNPTKAAL